MTAAATTDLMHCPKCGQNYPDGSQRFCDVEGARLVGASHVDRQREMPGVFSSVLSRSANEGSSDETTRSGLRSETSVHPAATGDPTVDTFFEEEDDEINDFTPVPSRKVNPYDIPPGHVEIDQGGEREHPSIHNMDFDPDHPEEFIGRTVKGRYRVVELIGEDDTGVDYLAVDRLAEDKNVTVRIVLNDEIDEITETILSEERVSLSHLNHPNIARLFDSGQFVDGTSYLICEHLDLLSVRDALQIHGPLDPLRAARIIRQAANAVSDVQHQGILHRDLRPEFIRLDNVDSETDQVKISNFGVSDGVPFGDAVDYAAPEVLGGQIPTTSTDVYSLGVIAYQMITGRLPFVGETAKDVLRSKRAGLVDHPSAFRRWVAPATDAIFDKVLSVDPLQRYTTAREFGDALYSAISEYEPAGEADRDAMSVEEAPVSQSVTEPVTSAEEVATESQTIEPAQAPVGSGEDLWTRRSPEPLNEPNHHWLRIAAIAALVFIIIAGGIWYYVLNAPEDTASQIQSEEQTAQSANVEVPPSPREIEQPPNTTFYQNTKAIMKGDISRNFVPFSLYYPNDWKVVAPTESTEVGLPGKFLDISSVGADGKMHEQMIISYYPSKGTFADDTPAFPDLVRGTNDTLKKILPNYEMVSEEDTVVNGGWKAHEVKFQGAGTGENGQKLIVWGRRLFIPAMRPGVRNGFAITMLATSASPDVHSVDDVGVHGDLAAILYTFEPGENY